MKPIYSKISEERVKKLELEGNWQCPSCMQILSLKESSALSRTDNKTKICDLCGRIEALNDYKKFRQINV